MQAELSSNQPLLDIEFLGVNWTGLESANPEATEGKSLPWLQDVDSDDNGASDVWENWGAEHLDLIMRDAHNGPLGYINLITTSLNEPENYTFLHDLLIDAAMKNQKPWHNAENPLDINHDGSVIPQDVLIIVNRLNSLGIETLPPPGVQAPQMFYDSNGDGDSTPLDALLVINFLNDQSGAGTGEAESVSLDAASEVDVVGIEIPWMPHSQYESMVQIPSVRSNAQSTFHHSEGQQSEQHVYHHAAHAAEVDYAFEQEKLDWLSEHHSPDQLAWFADHAAMLAALGNQ